MSAAPPMDLAQALVLLRRVRPLLAPDLQTAIDVVSNVRGGRPDDFPRRVTLPRLLESVQAVSGIELERLYSPSRTQSDSHARHWYYYLGRGLTPFSLEEIAEGLRRRDHATVVYGSARIRDLLALGDLEAEATRQRYLVDLHARGMEPDWLARQGRTR